jgi:hypothetical protein
VDFNCLNFSFLTPDPCSRSHIITVSRAGPADELLVVSLVFRWIFTSEMVFFSLEKVGGWDV